MYINPARYSRNCHNREPAAVSRGMGRGLRFSEEYPGRKCSIFLAGATERADDRHDYRNKLMEMR